MDQRASSNVGKADQRALAAWWVTQGLDAEVAERRASRAVRTIRLDDPQVALGAQVACPRCEVEWLYGPDAERCFVDEAHEPVAGSLDSRCVHGTYVSAAVWVAACAACRAEHGCVTVHDAELRAARAETRG